jgi:hypothetical protein
LKLRLSPPLSLRRSQMNYPANIQAAEARVAAEKGDVSGYGASSNGSSQAGR